jgi:hypothetical protein
MYDAGLILNLEKFVLAPWRPAQLPAIAAPSKRQSTIKNKSRRERPRADIAAVV